MDIEHLTKSQIVLLTLLVSFVTSIATGIVTVTLMQQAPTTVTQTINRVVERTIEKVASPQTQAAAVSAASPVTTERTVVVKEADQISNAVARVGPSVATIFTNEGEHFAARGVLIKSGIVATEGALEPKLLYTVRFQNGSEYKARIVVSGKGVALLQLEIASSSPRTSPLAVSSDPITLGQSVISVTGSEKTRVAQGIVTSISSEESTTTDAAVIPGRPFNVNLSAVPGSPVVSVDGSLIGITIDSEGTVAPGKALVDMLGSLGTTTPT